MTYTVPKRDDFDKKDRRFMLARSGQRCEAEGPRYGLDDGVRCNADLAYGVEFHHIIPTGAGGKGKGHPENGLAVCPKCHKHSTNTHDKQVVAKVKRQSDKHYGTSRKKQTMQSRPFQSRLKSDDKFARIAEGHKKHMDRMEAKMGARK